MLNSAPTASAATRTFLPPPPMIPYSGILTVDQLTGQVVQDKSGMGDPSLTFDVNFFGAPAMTAEQFRSFVPVTYSGLHLTLGTPWGSYDRQSRAKKVGFMDPTCVARALHFRGHG